MLWIRSTVRLRAMQDNRWHLEAFGASEIWVECRAGALTLEDAQGHALGLDLRNESDLSVLQFCHWGEAFLVLK